MTDEVEGVVREEIGDFFCAQPAVVEPAVNPPHHAGDRQAGNVRFRNCEFAGLDAVLD